MADKHLVIVGGGLAGLSAGCYARDSGYRTTIVEHNIALGGVCTAWPRGPYLVEGCMHWLTGGAFAPLYEELGIVPPVTLRTLEHFVTWRDARDGATLEVTRDLRRLAGDMKALAPADGGEIERLVDEAGRFGDLDPGIGHPAEITPLRDRLAAFWEMRSAAGTVLHYRQPLGAWARERLQSESLRRFLARLVPEDAPALVLLMVLGYLQRGWLSRPIGGSAAFRDALVAGYGRRGGQAIVHTTVDEILVDGGRACGVRLGDGSILPADAVISTSSVPETVLRLLGGRFEAAHVRERMAKAKLVPPIVLASFGVAAPLAEQPAMLFVDRVPPFDVGATRNDRLYLRICNDDPVYAPPGHAVVQALLHTDYEWWATRGTGYQAAKDDIARTALAQIAKAVPVAADGVRMTDVSTPLTFWRQARSWHGAYEGWMPSTILPPMKKRLAGLSGFCMAGQWVELGGGIPMAVMSGRQAVQILCAEDGFEFVP